MAPAAKNNHDRREVEEALAAFTADDWERFRRVAKHQLFRLAHLDPMDLLMETATRFLEGRRNWSKGEDFKAVFYNGLRSVADEFRADEASKPYITAADLPLDSDGQTPSLENFEVDSASPESAFAAAREIEEAFDEFADDQDVQAILAGRMVGLSADETIAHYAMTDDEYHAARKRLERWLARQE